MFSVGDFCKYSQRKNFVAALVIYIETLGVVSLRVRGVFGGLLDNIIGRQHNLVKY